MPVSCAAVREQLAEYAVGVLSERERTAVDRHLQWCAACRKEAEELTGAAASLALALRPAPVPESLLGRIVAAIARAARTPAFRRRTRAAASIAVAAMVAISALGWGAVMAGRAEKFEDRAKREAQGRMEELQRFRKSIRNFAPLGTGLRSDQTYLAQLAPVSGGQLGGGAALELVSPSLMDFVIVHVGGLAPGPRSMPYQIWLQDGNGNALRAGLLTELDADGGGESFHEFPEADLAGFTTVVIRDAQGDVVLRGVAEPAGS